MLPIYKQPHFTFFFAENRIIRRFHLQDVAVGRRVVVTRIDPVTHERGLQLVTGLSGEDGWVDLEESIIVKAGEAFVVDVMNTATTRE